MRLWLSLCAGIVSAKPPHIFFMLYDDWGWANLRSHNPGNAEVVTPNLDALITSGIRLDQHYVFKYCSPSRCALQSGRNPIREFRREPPYATP
jgi:arylsulfatase B